METKKINRLMAGIFLLHIVMVVVLVLLAGKVTIGVILNLSMGQIFLLIPTLIYLLIYKMGQGKEIEALECNQLISQEYGEKEEVNLPLVKKETLKERLMYNKLRPSTLVYILFFTWLSMPLTTLINCISMFFTENTVVEMSELILDVPFPLMLFMMAVMPACIEELLFRGVAYGGYRKAGSKFMAVMLSALMFGLMHMNLNQALYAFVLGIFMALLVEATGSLFSSMLFHFIYNAQSCCLMFMLEAISPGYYSDPANVAVTPEQLYIMVSVYLVIAAISTPLAFCMLYKISKNENRVAELMECLPKKQTGKASLVTPAFIVATVIAVGYIIFELVASAMIL